VSKVVQEILMPRFCAKVASVQGVTDCAIEKALRRPLLRPVKTYPLGLLSPAIVQNLFKRAVRTEQSDQTAERSNLIVFRASAGILFCLCAVDDRHLLADYEMAPVKALAKVCLNLVKEKRINAAIECGALLEIRSAEPKLLSTRRNSQPLQGRNIGSNRAARKSAVVNSVLETAKEFHAKGLIDALTMRELAVICGIEVYEFLPKQIKSIRTRCRVTQSEFARYFGVREGTVQKWEGGTKTPTLLESQLLDMVDRCGLQILLK
jgi:putative transcriptional regulator